MTIAADHLTGLRFAPPLRRTTRPRPAASHRNAAASAPAPAAAPAMTGAVTWSTVDSGFHVASRAGEFVGSIDATADGHFVANDATSAPIGRYGTLADARTAVVGWQPESARERERRVAKAFMPVATSAGLVAGATAALGAVVTTLPM